MTETYFQHAAKYWPPVELQALGEEQRKHFMAVRETHQPIGVAFVCIFLLCIFYGLPYRMRALLDSCFPFILNSLNPPRKHGDSAISKDRRQ